MSRQLKRPLSSTVKPHGTFIALMLEDVAESARMAQALRTLGMLAQVFSSPDEFWQATTSEIPDLAIVDLKIMNGRDRLLIDHPRLKDKTLPLMLYVRAETMPLLPATYPLFHLGIILKEDNAADEVPYVGQLRSCLQKVDFLRSLQTQTTQLSDELNREKQKTKMLVASTQKMRQNREVQGQIAEALSAISRDLPVFGIWDSVARLFESWDWIKGYGILTFSANGKQLIAPGLQKSKYHRLPAVWLGKENRKGVPYFSQSMAYQVAQEVIGENLRPLALSAPGKDPEALIFVQLKDQENSNFDWEYFKSLLGLFLIRQEQVEEQLQMRLKTLAPWEMLTRLDQEYGENLESNAQLYTVDLTEFTTMLRKRHKEIFFWQDFHRDLVMGLARVVPEKSQMSYMNWDRVAIFVPEKSKLDLLENLKNYFERFPYWRFCQDEDTLFTQIFKPAVRMVPVSARALISSLYSPSEKVATSSQAQSQGPVDWSGPLTSHEV